jgi:long-subunit acyl-CoA synthetase (AMP-forming)
VDDVRLDSKLTSYIDKCIEKANLKAVSRVSKVKRWSILDYDFSVEGGELTPTAKVKRNYVYKKYQP